MPNWTIQHRTLEGGLNVVFKPAEEITFTRNRNAPSSIAYKIGRSDPLLQRDSIAPYETYFHLFRDAVRIMSGPVTEVEWDSDDEGVISVAGQSWLHHMERRVAPVNIPDRQTWFKEAGQISTVVENLVAIFNDYDAYLGAGDPLIGVNPGVRWVVDSVVPGGGLGTITTMVSEQLAALDGQTMFDLIKRIGENEDGYDFEGFWYGADAGGPGPNGELCRLVLYHPTRREAGGRMFKKFTNRGPTATTAELVTLKWRDLGPKANRGYYIGNTLGLTVGVLLQANKDVAIRTHVGGINRCGLLEEQFDLSTFVDEAAVGSAATSQFQIDRENLYEVDLSFDTQVVPNFWTQADPGDWIEIDYDFGFHRIRGNYVMNSYTATISPNGDELITPDLEYVNE